MIPIVQVILALAGVLFGGKLTGMLGLTPPPANDRSTEGRVYVMSDHPAAAAGVGTVPAPATGGPAAPPAPGTAPNSPTVKSITQDVVRQPWTVWGLAFAGLTLPLVISQLRAATHEAASGARTVYDEGRSVYTRVDRADDYVQNRSRAKRRK